MTKGKIINIKNHLGYIETYLIIDSTAYQFRHANKTGAYFGNYSSLIKISQNRYLKSFESILPSSAYWYEKLDIKEIV